MRSLGHSLVVAAMLLCRAGHASRSTQDDDGDDRYRRSRKYESGPTTTGGTPSGTRLLTLLDGKAGQSLQRELAECEFTKQRSRRLEGQVRHV